MKRYITTFQKFIQDTQMKILEDWQIEELKNFHIKIGYNFDRRKTLAQFVKLQYKNWVTIWNKLQSIHNGTRLYHRILYGKVEGDIKYFLVSKRKTKHFQNMIEYHIENGKTFDDAVMSVKTIQTNRSQKSVERIKTLEPDARTCRQLGWWIERGFTVEQAAEQVKRVQTTNGYDYYVDPELQKQRNEKWQKSLKENPKNANIGFKRGHSLARYIQRANGDEIAGFAAYKKYRKTLNGWCGASRSSLQVFKPIIEYCSNNGIECFYGADGKHEWIIRHDNKPFLYDLAIPSMKIIVEFNGETWHPNPNMSVDSWKKWKHPHTKETADQRLAHDNLKLSVARNNGWNVFVIWESSPDISDIMETIKNARF
jgi:hypothetical protein